MNSPKRLDRPRSKQGDVSWDKAWELALQGLKKAGEGKARAWAVAGAAMTNEELFLFRKLAKDTLGLENFAVMAEPDVPELNFPKFKAPKDGNPNRIGAQILLGVQNAEESVARFAKACAAGEVEHVLVWSSLPHGIEQLPELTRALAAEKVTNVVAVDFQSSVLSELAGVTLATTTWVESGGSWVNHQMLLQAFRPALPAPRQGRVGVEILQELLNRLQGVDAAAAVIEAAPIGGLADPALGGAVQRASGSATVALLAGSGEVALKSRRVVVSAAAVFDELAAGVPQFGGHSHLNLIRQRGAFLV